MAKRLREDNVLVHGVLRNFVPDMRMKHANGSDDRDSLLYLGIVEKHKGVETLVDAFEKSRDSQEFRLVLVGQGLQRERILRRIERSGLKDRISVPGYLPYDEIISIRNRSLAQIVPSEWLENAPLSAIESLSMGVPLIASDIGGLPEIADDSSGSKRFPAGDSARLAEALVNVWQERDRFEMARRLARTAYEERYSPQIHMRQYLNIVKGATRD
jgi:glycosyltransferase involved in cell wall biosynthesis